MFKCSWCSKRTVWECYFLLYNVWRSVIAKVFLTCSVRLIYHWLYYSPTSINKPETRQKEKVNNMIFRHTKTPITCILPILVQSTYEASLYHWKKVTITWLFFNQALLCENSLESYCWWIWLRNKYKPFE